MIQFKKYFFNPDRIAVIVTKFFPLQKVLKNARAATIVKYHDDAGGLPGAGVFPCNRGKGSIFTNIPSLQIISPDSKFQRFKIFPKVSKFLLQIYTHLRDSNSTLSKYFMLCFKVNAKTIHGCDLQ